MTRKTLALMVTSPPHHNYTATALAFAEQALLSSDTKLIGVFFYQDGVQNANTLLTMPNDELQAIKAWQKLHHQFNLPLHLCISAGEKRGLKDDESGSEVNNILDEFTISGLGELVELTAQADRVVQL